MECECGSRYYERGWNDDPVWVCVDCARETPRRRRPRRTDKITPSQQATVDFLRENHLRVRSLTGQFEVKEFEVELRDSGDVMVVSEIGRKDDEGTALVLFGRDRRYFLVGRNGGVQLLNAEKKSKSRGRRNALYAETWRGGSK